MCNYGAAKIPVLDKSGKWELRYFLNKALCWKNREDARQVNQQDAAYVVLFVFMPDFAGSKRKENVLRAIK